MGLYAGAELIWGIPVLAWDDEGEPTPFWSEEDEDWREFDGLEVVTYGHYEDPDRAILTIKGSKRYDGDCWEPTPVSARCLDMDEVNVYQEEWPERLERNGLADYLDEASGYWLVASFG